MQSVDINNSVSHDPFFQNMHIIFHIPIPYPSALKMKYYNPSQGK